MVNSGRLEAFARFREWASREATLRVDVAFFRLAFAARAMRLLAIEEDMLKLLSVDADLELTVALAPAAEFIRGDYSANAPDEAATYGRCVTIYLPSIHPDGVRDSVRLTERRAES